MGEEDERHGYGGRGRLDWRAARGLDGAGCAQKRDVLIGRRFVSGRDFGCLAGEGEDQKIAKLVETKPGVGT